MDGKWLVFASEEGGISDETPLAPAGQPYGEVYAYRIDGGADGAIDSQQVGGGIVVAALGLRRCFDDRHRAQSAILFTGTPQQVFRDCHLAIINGRFDGGAAAEPAAAGVSRSDADSVAREQRPRRRLGPHASRWACRAAARSRDPAVAGGVWPSTPMADDPSVMCTVRLKPDTTTVGTSTKEKKPKPRDCDLGLVT